MKKRILSIILTLVMIVSIMPLGVVSSFAALGEEPEQPSYPYTFFISISGLSHEGVEYTSITKAPSEVPYYVVPENEDTVVEGFTFRGFFCKETKKYYQIGETIPLADFTEQTDVYRIALIAVFTENEKPGVTYTDINRYNVEVSIVWPDELESAIKTSTGSFASLEGENIGTAEEIRQLRLSYYRTFSPRGYRSLVTGTVFNMGDTFDLDKLSAPVYTGQKLEQINDKEGNRVSVYEITDTLVPIFEYLGVTGAYLDPLYECTINYYIPVVTEIEGQEPFISYATVGTDELKLSMFDYDFPIELTVQPEYMEDLGYIFEGYGALTDDEITYPEGEIFMDQYSTNDGEGHLTYAIKLFYSEPDEDATPEEILAASKEKISAKYQAILNDETASDGMKAIAAEVINAVANAADRDEIKDICSAYEEKFALQEAKDIACEELIALAPEDASEAVMEIIAKGIEEINKCDNTDDFDDIISEARYEINQLTDGDINFEFDKAEAVEQILALADEDASDELKAIVEKAAQDAANAKDYDELTEIVLKLQADIAALNLAEVKDAAIAEINAAITGANSIIAEAAIIDINNATSAEDVNDIKTRALSDMANSAIATSAITDAPEYELGSAVTFTVVTHEAVEKIGLANENGMFITKLSEQAVSNGDGTKTWTIQAAFETKGTRTIDIYAAGPNLQLVDTGLSVDFSVARFISAGEDKVAVISAYTKDSALVNEAFAITVKTTTSASKIGIFTESGSALGKISQSYVDKNGERTWTITTNVGSKGNRELTVKATDYTGEWSEGKTVAIKIYKL